MGLKFRSFSVFLCRGSATGTAESSALYKDGAGLRRSRVWAEFNDSAQIHDPDMVADALDNGHIVADEEHGDAKIGL